MSESSFQSPERLREQAIAALVPFFDDGTADGEKNARVIGASSLDEYKAATPKELQLATQIIAYGWTVLACLRTAAVVKHTSLDEMLEWQDAAIKLHRLSEKARKALEARRKERVKNAAAMTKENTAWDEGAFQRTINQAVDKMTEANAKFAACMPELAPAPVKPAVNLDFLFPQPMTPSVLARRARH